MNLHKWRMDLRYLISTRLLIIPLPSFIVKCLTSCRRVCFFSSSHIAVLSIVFQNMPEFSIERVKRFSIYFECMVFQTTTHSLCSHLCRPPWHPGLFFTFKLVIPPRITGLVCRRRTTSDKRSSRNSSARASHGIWVRMCDGIELVAAVPHET